MFVGNWLAGQGVWGILGFLTLGDSENPSFYDLSKWGSPIAALFLASFAFVRLTLGRVDTRYPKINLMGSLMMISVTGGVFAYEFIREIDGSSPRAAAESAFANYRVDGNSLLDPNLPLQLKQGVPPRSDYPGTMPADRTFVRYQGDDPLSWVIVSPHGPYWYRVSSSGQLIPSEQVWQNIRQFWDKRPQLSRSSLLKVIKNYPGTKAERKATQLLEQLNQDHPPNEFSQR
jgi:hypothetical protein